MEKIEMKFPGVSAADGDPFRLYPQKRNWRSICCISLLILFILPFFIITLVFLNNNNNNNKDNIFNDQQAKNASAQHQKEILNGDPSFHNISVLVHDLHNQVKMLHGKIDLLSIQNSTTSSSSLVPFSQPPVQINGNETKNDKEQNSTKNSDSASENSPRGSILQLISNTKPDSKKVLVDVIGKGKAHIVMRVPEHDHDYIEFDFNQKSTLNPPCQNLPFAFHSYSTSATIDTLGTCIRIFSLDDCVGDSKAFYPKIKDGDDSGSFTFRSLGRCLANELDESFFKTEEKSGGKKEMKFRKYPLKLHNNNISVSDGPAVPDHLQLDSFISLDSTSHFNKAVYRVITDFNVDAENRIKLIRAVIQHKDLKSGPGKVAFSYFYQERKYNNKVDELKKSMKKGDNLGFFIGLKFSPQEDEISKNVFYQSSWNFRHLREVEDTIYNWLEKNPTSSVEIRVQVYYKEKENRPEGFLYWIKYNYKDKDASNVQMYYLRNV